VIQYHPDDNLLIEFANGSLDIGLGILINAHLEQCPHCQTKVKSFERIGGNLLAANTQAPVSDDCFAYLMQKIERQGRSPVSQPARTLAPSEPQDAPDYPKIISKLLLKNPKARWQRISRSLRAHRLVTGQNKYEVALHNICSGGQVSEHDHSGMEYTLVVRGSFSDADGIYRKGDFVVKHPGQVHRPTASQNEDCLCLSAVEAPVRLTGFLGKLINPFLSIRPA
jgi:putative transcriptional regulator